MPRGGHRSGAGRKKGAITRMNEAARAKAAAGGITPLEYLLSLLRDVKLPRDVRVDAAKAAAPYMHAKLANVEHSGEISHNYVARMPAPVRDIDEWQRQNASLQ